MLIINYKAYSNAIGEEVEELTSEVEQGAKDEVVVCPQTADLNRVDTELQVFAQHIDSVEAGSHTGSNQVKAVKDAGATGTLINHSEKQIEDEKIRETVTRAKDEGLETVVCAQSPEQCGKYSEYGPDYIAFEPPELIGGDVAVSTAEPELIEKAVKLSDVPVLTGAGIKSREDVEKSVELGCEGVLVASGVVKSEKPAEEVRELCEGL